MRSLGKILFVGLLTFFMTSNVYAEHYLGRAYNLYSGVVGEVIEVDTSSTDITDSLYNSLNTACSKAVEINDKVMVHIENGNYTITEKNMILCSNVYLVMEPNTVITKVDGSNTSIIRTTADSKTNNAIIYGGKLDVNGKGKSAIELVNATNVTAMNIYLTGGTNSGMRIADSKDSGLIDGTVYGNTGYGIFITNSTSVISRTGSYDNQKSGIYAKDNSVVKLYNSSLSDNKEDGANIVNSTYVSDTNEYYSNRNAIYGNNSVISSANDEVYYAGIKATTNSKLTLKNTFVTESKNNGVDLSASTATITNSKIYNNGKNGLYATTKSNVTLRDSEIYSNKEYGIQIIEGSILKANDGANNKIYSNNYSGVSASGKGTEIYLHKNQITGNGVKPKTTSDGAVGHGVGVSEGAYANITNNEIKNNKECGISVFDGAKVKIVNNRITNNGRHGIGARKNITVKEITDNTISNNGYNGVLLADKTNGPLKNNTISENGGFGLSVVDNSTTTLNNNTITYNTSSNISISKGDAKLKGAKVTLEKGNYVAYSKKEHGIAVSGATSLVINNTGNKVERNKKNGLSVTGESSLKISAATTVYGNGESGIYIKNSTASIKSAKVRKNANHGVFINNSGDLDIWKSTISQNGNYGINISGSKVTAKVSTNTIESNDVGVTVNNGATVSTIKNSTIKSNKSFGIMIRNKSLVKEVNNNKIENNKEKGIFMNNSATANKIKKNTINSNGEYGIMLMNNSTALDVYKNTISNHTKYGVATYSATIKKLTSTNKYSNNQRKNYYVGV